MKRKTVLTALAVASVIAAAAIVTSRQVLTPVPAAGNGSRYQNKSGSFYRRWPTYGDGDCLFVALYCGVKMWQGVFVDPMNSLVARAGARDMRQRTVDFIERQARTNKAYRDSIRALYGDPGQYIKDMRGKAYADEFALTAWQQVYKIGVQAFEFGPSDLLVAAGEPVFKPAKIWVVNDRQHFELLTK